MIRQWTCGAMGALYMKLYNTQYVKTKIAT